MLERAENFLKKVITAGLVLVGSELHAQNFDHWITVTPEEFKRRNISNEKIDSVDMRVGDAPEIDNSKEGRVYSDKNGNTFYWINTHPIKSHDYTVDTVSESEADIDNEKQIVSVLGDPEIQNTLEQFNTSFEIKYPYGILTQNVNDDGYGYSDYKKGAHVLIFRNIKQEIGASTILFDKVRGVEVFVPLIGNAERSNSLANDFTEQVLQKGLAGAIRWIILEAKKHQDLSSFEKKKEFVKSFFSQAFPDLVTSLDHYVPPDINVEQYESMMSFSNSGIRSQSDGNYQVLERADDFQKIHLDDKSLDDILREDK